MGAEVAQIWRNCGANVVARDVARESLEENDVRQTRTYVSPLEKDSLFAEPKVSRKRAPCVESGGVPRSETAAREISKTGGPVWGSGVLQ